MNHFKKIKTTNPEDPKMTVKLKSVVASHARQLVTTRTSSLEIACALLLLIVGLAHIAKAAHEAQRVPWDSQLAGDNTARSLDARRASEASDTPLWPSSHSKNVNHFVASGTSTDLFPQQDNSVPAGSINHLRAIARQLRPHGDKSSGSQVNPGTSCSPQLNHLRARRSPAFTLTSANSGDGGAHLVSPPKLVQWSREPVQYHEGSTLVLSCSLSYAGGEQAPLKFAWFKQGKPLVITTTGGGGASQSSKQNERLSIETLADYSFLRLADLRPADSGGYTCLVSNTLNQEDRTTTQVIVNVKLKWLAGGPGGSQVDATNSTTVGNGHQLERARAGHSVSFECNAAGGHSRSPRVRWFRWLPSGSGNSATAAAAAAVVAATTTTSGAFRNLRLGQTPDSSSGRLHTAVRSMDEAQLRMGLMQLDSTTGEGLPYRRIELVEDNELIREHGNEILFANNGTRNRQLKWRIESNSGSGANMVTNQQHEVYSRLVLDRLDPSASGLYECEVIGTLQQSSHFEGTSTGTGGPAMASGDKLRRVFGLLVNGRSAALFQWRVQLVTLTRGAIYILASVNSTVRFFVTHADLVETELRLHLFARERQSREGETTAAADGCAASALRGTVNRADAAPE